MAKSQKIEVQIPVAWGHIACCWYGDQQRRPILAVHGWQDNAGSFAPLAELIAPYASVLAIDLPGHGRSSHLPPGMHYNSMDFVRVMLHIKRYYKWSKIALMGHSMGATMCFHFAALFPQLVDIMISFDSIQTRNFLTDVQIKRLQYTTDKCLIVDERLWQKPNVQPLPPLYTFAELELLLHNGSDNSVDLACCKYILERSVSRSAAKPDMYYFSRDERVKYVTEYITEPALTLEMAKRIRNVNYLTITIENSDHINEESADVVAVLRANNPNFELYVIPKGTHHVHLNKAKQVADYVIPFVQKYYKSDVDEQLMAASKL